VALIQGIISLITRSIGRIFSALFDWAVVALFGRVEGSRKLWLSGLMGAAAMWPILLAGVAFPKVTVFAVAFVPLSGNVPSGWIRIGWLALVVLVPLTVGAVLRVQAPPDRPRQSWPASLLNGFPITLGLSAAFVVLLLTVPVLRIASAVRGRRDIYMPLVTTTESYDTAAHLAARALRRNGLAVERAEPPWWSSLPSTILHKVGKQALVPYVPDNTAYFANGDLEIAVYPNALLVRGSVQVTAQAQGVLAEALTGHPDIMQTVSAEAQEIERQIQRVWSVYRENPAAHENAWPLRSRLDDIARAIAAQKLPFDEWQVVYRQSLQLDRALDGEPPLVEHVLDGPSGDRAAATGGPGRHTFDGGHVMDHETTRIAHENGGRVATPIALGPAPGSPAIEPGTHALSTRELLSRIFQTGSHLVTKEIELARAEVKADLEAELGMVKMLAAAAVGALLGVNLLLVAAVFALALWMPGWLAALGLAAVVLVVSAIVGYVGWQRRVRTPLAVTRKTVTEDMQWVKERLA
jgi:hypothetical protein